MSDTRLRIQSQVSITEPLPLAHLARIESVPGVDGVGYYNFVGGYYQEPRNGISSGAMDIEPAAGDVPRSQRLARGHGRDGADAQRRVDRRGSGQRARLEDRRPDPAELEHLHAQGRRAGLDVRDRRYLLRVRRQGAQQRALVQLLVLRRCAHVRQRHGDPVLRADRNPARAAEISEPIDSCSRTRRTRRRRRTNATGCAAVSLRSATWGSSSTRSSPQSCSRCCSSRATR